MRANFLWARRRAFAPNNAAQRPPTKLKIPLVIKTPAILLAWTTGLAGTLVQRIHQTTIA